MAAGCSRRGNRSTAVWSVYSRQADGVGIIERRWRGGGPKQETSQVRTREKEETDKLKDCCRESRTEEVDRSQLSVMSPDSGGSEEEKRCSFRPQGVCLVVKKEVGVVVRRGV